jgi:hypothetical protein
VVEIDLYRINRINQRHLLLIKVDNATFVDLKAWRKYSRRVLVSGASSMTTDVNPDAGPTVGSVMAVETPGEAVRISRADAIVHDVSGRQRPIDVTVGVAVRSRLRPERPPVIGSPKGVAVRVRLRPTAGK